MSRSLVFGGWAQNNNNPVVKLSSWSDNCRDKTDLLIYRQTIDGGDAIEWVMLMCKCSKFIHTLFSVPVRERLWTRIALKEEEEAYDDNVIL